jgi:hypothetical protein
MKLVLHRPAKDINKAYLKQSLRRDQFETFKAHLVTMFERLKPGESEEHLKMASLVYDLYGLTEEEIALVEGKQ